MAKGCVLFMTSQIRKDKKIEYCNKDLVSKTIYNIFRNNNLYSFVSHDQGSRQNIRREIARRGAHSMDLGAIDCLCDTGDWLLHTFVAYLFL